jgi:hypothetical protein
LQGNLLPTPEERTQEAIERAEQEAQRADAANKRAAQEAQRADAADKRAAQEAARNQIMAEKLRALGIEPDEIG